MSALSNLLRQRLGGAGGGTEEAGSSVHPDSMIHPDADTLTAYVEQLLPSAERKSVVTHLSVCALCRDVVALSLPQLPEVAQGQAAIPASPAFRWRRLWTPGFRWAGAMAVVAVAAALVIELPRRPQPQFAQPQGAQSEAARPQAAGPEAARSAEQTKAAPVPEQPVASKPERDSADKVSAGKSAEAASSASRGFGLVASDLRAERRLQPSSLKDMQVRAAILDAKKETFGRQTAEEAKSTAFSVSAVKQDYVNNDFFAPDANTNGAVYKYDNLPQPPAPQLTAQPGLAAGAPTQLSNFSGIPPSVNKKSKLRTFVHLSAVEHLGCILCKVVDVGHLGTTTPSSPAITTGAVTSSAMDVHGKFNSSLVKGKSTQLAAAPEKSASGILERSEAFTHPAAAAPAARSREGASAQVHWKVTDGKLFKSLDLDQWQDAYPRADANFEFSFVAAHGADVWAGGSHAALLHSRDGGTMWESVKLGDSASGTIVSIVVNGLSVQVKTSDNQSWSSSDGKTWAPQSGQD